MHSRIRLFDGLPVLVVICDDRGLLKLHTCPEGVCVPVFRTWADAQKFSPGALTREVSDVDLFKSLEPGQHIALWLGGDDWDTRTVRFQVEHGIGT